MRTKSENQPHALGYAPVETLRSTNAEREAELPLTQVFLAQMTGVRRTSVTAVATELQKEGLISYSRGKINILSMDLIEQRACECHKAVREMYFEMFGSVEGLPGRSSIEQTGPGRR